MLVTRENFDSVLQKLQYETRLSLDTETYGLRPYHGDKLFSIILGKFNVVDMKLNGITPYYFNFQPYADQPPETVLTNSHLVRLNEAFFKNPKILWFIHNAKYDMAILAADGIELVGEVHCTQAIARVEYNEHHQYDLDSCGSRIGFPKDETVKQYILDNDLWEWESRPGSAQRKKNLHYDKVPFELIVPYGERDAEVGGHIAFRQTTAIVGASLKTRRANPNLPGLDNVMENERRLTKTVFRMEQRGVLIDQKYCVKAQAYENDLVGKALASFKRETGRDFSASPKLFKEVFASEKDIWQWGDETETGQVNPCFDSDVLKTFKNPAARLILDYRDAKSKADFYAGFLYHCDASGVVHPNFNPGGARTGRFTSSGPNLQNLTAENASSCRACGEEFEAVVSKCPDCGSADIASPEFLVRRAIIPRPGFVFIMPDYDQMEYRMMFDYACQEVGYETALVRKIKTEGLDPHQATANVVTEGGTPLTRKRAKNGNFAILYGSGVDTLASTIGSTRQEAFLLKKAILTASPEIKEFVDSVMNAAVTNGYVRNWLGRRSWFPNHNFAYKAPNSLIQGGTADVNKVALNRMDEFFLETRSKLALTIHDENPIEVHESELATVPRRAKEFMESVYPSTYLPLTVGMEWSARSLGDKIKGFPV